MAKLSDDDDRKVPWVLKWVWVIGPIMVATAMLLMVIELRTPSERRVVKGGPQMQIFAQHGEAHFPVGEGKRLMPGDSLRFIVEPAGRHYLLIASLDSKGLVTIYYPYGGRASGLLPAGDTVELPGSVVLNETRGTEHLAAIFSDTPYQADLVAAVLRGGERLPGLPGLTLRLSFEKGPPASPWRPDPS